MRAALLPVAAASLFNLPISPLSHPTIPLFSPPTQPPEPFHPPTHPADPLEIAYKELREKVIPFTIRRYLPDGSYEDHDLKDLIIPER